MVKKISFIVVFILIAFISKGQLDSIYYHQDFEIDSLPGGIPSSWNERVPPSIYDWTTRDGGRNVLGYNNPSAAYEGSYNAAYIAQVGTVPITYLVLPSIDLKYAIEPELRFYHAQEEDPPDNDYLEVFYRTGKDSAWVSLESQYTLPTPNDTWVERIIPLPDGTLVDSCIIGFEGTSNWGMGVCIDDIWVQEKGVLAKYVGSIKYYQASTNFVATESSDNPILRIDVEVLGNSGTAILDSLIISSKNTNDTDVKTNGVKIFRTREAEFSTKNQVGTGVSFVDGTAEFDLDYDFPYGVTYLWVTYDIDQDPTHEIHNHIADAYIDVNHIKLNGGYYPAAQEDPTGDRTIIESVSFDDFETLKGWVLTPALEFQIDTPQGKGNFVDHGLFGNTDPANAFQGVRVLGSDLRGGSDPFPYGYDSTLTDREYNAVSPLINCDYYRELKLIFQRYLNVGATDEVSIDISTDSGSSWDNLWRNSGTITDAKWQEQEIALPDSMAYQPNVKVRFGIGPTSASVQYTGWNIDNFAIVGNYMSADLAVTNILAPLDGCGHTSTDSITITIENVGGLATNDTVPLLFTPDGFTLIRDTIFASIGIGEDTTYTFTPTVDLSVNGLYDEAYATTNLPGDEYNGNDTAYHNIYVPPTFSLPYFENFENGNLHWIPSGINSSWQFGEPTGSTINSAFSPDSVWITNLGGGYNQNEDSYLESPCYNLTDMDYSIFEMKLWSDTEEGVDGGALEYSIDNGFSWNVVERLMYKDFNWLWYTNTTGITATGTNGWDTISNEYLTVSTFLPEALQDESSVKFRIIFASDGNIVNHEGFAIDDIKIYEAPVNTGVTSIDYPTNPICETTSSELITVSVKNFGLDTLEVGDTIFLGYEFDGGALVKDTIILTEIIKPDSIKQITSSIPIDLSGQGFYNLEVYTLDTLPNFYSAATDSVSDLIEVRGNPIFDIGPDLYTVLPDTVVLDAYPGSSGYSYLWQDLTTTSSTFSVSGPGTFEVTVTDDATACFSIDSTHIFQLIADIGVDSLFSPTSACELADSVYIQTRIQNYGTDTLEINDTVRIAYEINGGLYRVDTFLLPQILLPDSLYSFTSIDTFDMSVPQAYNLKLYSILADDIDGNNDTIAKTIDVYGYPAFSLEPEDTVMRAIDYTIDAGAGFTSYLWQDDSDSQTFDATSTDWYYATVTDANDCPENDSIHVTLIIQDISVTALSSPVEACGLGNETVEITISNLGSDTIFTNDTIIIGYLVDDTPTGRDSIFLTGDFLPTNTLDHTFVDLIDMSILGDYEFKPYVIGQGELVPSNDTLTSVVTSKNDPLPIDIGPDTYSTPFFPINLDAGTGTGYTYLWQNGHDGQILYVQDEGTYSVTVTDAENCTGTDETTVVLNAIIEINDESAELNIYPNPVSEILHFELTTSQQIDLILQLIDMNGKIVYRNNLSGHGKVNDDIHVLDYPAGTYIIKLIIEDAVFTDQIIIQ